MKKCTKCNTWKPINNFKFAITNKDKLTNTCKSCISDYNRSRYREDPLTQYVRGKRSECKKKSIPFDLDRKYLESIWTGICPVFKTPINLGNEGHKSTSAAHLDRLIPSKGYVKGNVNFLSARANFIKHDASIEELEIVLNWLKSSLESATTIPDGSTLQANGSGSGEPLLEGDDIV